MNYFAHALPFLDEPYVAAGTGVPDWLTVADRGCRIRRKSARSLVGDPDPIIDAVGRGTLQHLLDDARFHETRAFMELTLAFTAVIRDLLSTERGFRPSFLAHLLVEVLLDASLVARREEQVRRYYDLLDEIDPAAVEAAVNRMAVRPTARLAGMITGFCRERILWDYLDDGKLWGRLNQVMRRVKFPPLEESFCEVLPELRRRVAEREAELLAGIPVALS